MKKFNFDDQDRKEWMKLGFFYDFNDSLHRWEFYGDKSGLLNFHSELKSYAGSEKNFGLSEHIHLGPYAYLKIVTWTDPVINRDGFYGSIEDIKRLASIFIQKLNSTNENDCFAIGDEYSNHNEATLLVCVKESGFDPSSLDSASPKEM